MKIKAWLHKDSLRPGISEFDVLVCDDPKVLGYYSFESKTIDVKHCVAVSIDLSYYTIVARRDSDWNGDTAIRLTIVRGPIPQPIITSAERRLDPEL